MPIIADTAGLSASGGGSTAGGVIKIVLGAVIVLLGVKQWRGRPHADRQGNRFATNLVDLKRDTGGAATIPHGSVRARPPVSGAPTCSLRPLSDHGIFVVRGIGTAPEWNVRLKPWGGREDHDYGRNDQS
jgi:hypothetical protein